MAARQGLFKLGMLRSVACGCLLVTCCHVDAASAQLIDEHDIASRQSYSLFGLGFSFVDYEESTTISVDDRTVDIETDLGAIFTQSSSGYVAINRNWGFYLYTTSTLGVPQSTEEWEVDDTVIRTNKVSFEQQRLGALASYRFKSTYHILFGAQYGKFEFKRFAPQLTPAAANFGVDENMFTEGTVSETVWDINVLGGFERNTLFINESAGWRYQLQGVIGIPITTNISNTDVSDGQVFNASFNGIELRFNGVFGYQFNKNFIVGASLQLEFVQRYSLARDVAGDSTTTEFPANRVISLFPSLGAYWSF